jgi:hypothetical protein
VESDSRKESWQLHDLIVGTKMFLPVAIATVYNCRAPSEPAAVLNRSYPICNGLLSIHQRTAQTARACNKLCTRASDSSGTYAIIFPIFIYFYFPENAQQP